MQIDGNLFLMYNHVIKRFPPVFALNKERKKEDIFVKKRKYGSSYKPSAKRIKHVDEVLKFLRVMTKDKRYEIRFSEEEQKRGVSMCEIIDKYINDGIKQGRAEGINRTLFALRLIREGKSDQQVMLEAQLSEEELAAIKEMAFAAV